MGTFADDDIEYAPTDRTTDGYSLNPGFNERGMTTISTDAPNDRDD